MRKISEIPFRDWPFALKRGEITVDQAKREIAIAEVLIEVVQLDADTEWKSQPISQRWAEGCRRADRPDALEIPHDVALRLG